MSVSLFLPRRGRLVPQKAEGKHLPSIWRRIEDVLVGAIHRIVVVIAVGAFIWCLFVLWCCAVLFKPAHEKRQKVVL